ncbi:MAG: MBOAT family protein [Chitinophagaceae bacterium]|nr:MBOAT family protein [Chitinophagaceae bacterium]
MIFNSLTYAGFLIVVFCLYWFVAKKSFRAQNAMLLVASYMFYGFWDWRFLFLLAFSTALDYFTGLKIYNAASTPARKTWLTISVVVNLGFLCMFKYFNFFVGSFAGFLKYFDLEPNIPLLNVILPVGISFYTFHGLSYVFDIYNRRIQPTTNIIDYSLFVSFFPLLVAGPIERATHLLPQVSRPRVFSSEKASDGLRQILWGLFKKIVIADNCALLVNDTFDNPDGYSSLSLIIGAVFFAFQIYCDFSGYTDIALGSARLLGFELLRNFNYPYFARDIAEFWRRWHISLTSWFKDYVYIPLGGNRGAKSKTIRNTIIVFLLSGLWHGANWTFVLWALFHAVLFVPLVIMGAKRKHAEPIRTMLPHLMDAVNILITFVLVTIGWIIFRAESASQAWLYFKDIVAPRSTTSILASHPEAYATAWFIIILLLVEWVQKQRLHGLNFVPSRVPQIFRFVLYTAIIIFLVWFGGKPEEFIYFQF